MAQSIQREPAFLRRKQVQTRTGLARSTIYQYIKDGAFPKPVLLGARAVGWFESDVSDWIAVRVSVARAPPSVLTIQGAGLRHLPARHRGSPLDRHGMVT